MSKIVAIASSTGGPRALQAVFSKIPAGFEPPVLVVQHMPHGFTASLAQRLDGVCGIKVKEAEEGEEIKSGTAYISMGGLHMTVKKERSGRHVIRYLDEPTREGVKPCANYMYESLADSGYDRIICAVLTGMGADGTEGIANLKKRKSIYVVAQDKDSCVVYGMPKNVVQAGLADEEVPLDRVMPEIIQKANSLR